MSGETYDIDALLREAERVAPLYERSRMKSAGRLVGKLVAALCACRADRDRIDWLMSSGVHIMWDVGSGIKMYRIQTDTRLLVSSPSLREAIDAARGAAQEQP